uniref:Uncharacterized protein n=1 Tax=Rhizophora mucronata TaxID=61149 RepID=A0A2P2NX53_RHIMU
MATLLLYLPSCSLGFCFFI